MKTKLRAWFAIGALALGLMACDDDVMPPDPGGNTGGSTGDTGGLPPTVNYGAKGPFSDARMFSDTGPTGTYVLYRPDASLGRDGFKHPIVAWGNGIMTTPDQYQQLLTLVASHGFVVIGCPDIVSEGACLTQGLDWLVQQNNAPGPLQGKLDVTKEATIGYSWGGGAAIDAAARPNSKAVISLHGMPPRGLFIWSQVKSPLLLFTSTGDGFVTASGYVTPNYNASQTQTFYATLQDPSAGHLYPVDEGAISCVVSIALGACKSAIAEQAPVVAWLRYWLMNDQGARGYFWGNDCELCGGQWRAQRKNWL